MSIVRMILRARRTAAQRGAQLPAITPEPYFTIGPIDPKYDRTYRGRGRATGEVFAVNVARLECNCQEWLAKRSVFSSDDARRVCEHIYDKLHRDTPMSREASLFIRYARPMFDCRFIRDAQASLAIGPIWTHYIRAVGYALDHPVISTLDKMEEEPEWIGLHDQMPDAVRAVVDARARRLGFI